MARVINPLQYDRIASIYSLAAQQLNAPKDYIHQAVYQIVLLNNILPTYDLIRPFQDAYSATAVSSGYPSSWIQAVAALNAHVLSKNISSVTGLPLFSTLDAYLEDTTLIPGKAAITVPQAWADMSLQAGYSIDAGNIESVIDPSELPGEFGPPIN